MCIVATHFGKGYCANGEVHPDARRILEQLASRPGWFPPVGTLLDFLRGQRTDASLPRREWRHMQWRWFRDLVSRHLAARRRGKTPR